MTGRKKQHPGVTRSGHQTASSRDEFAGFFGIFVSRKGPRPREGSLARDSRCMLIMYWHSLSCTAVCWVQLGLGGLPELISECPARFPKRLLKPLGLRVSCYWAKCPTSDCDQHALCRLQVAPLYLFDPTIKAPRVRARKDQRWQNCSMV